MIIKKCDDLPSDGYWHVALHVKGGLIWIQKYNMSKEELLIAVVNPYRSWEEISVHGYRINRADILQIKISHTNISADSFDYVTNGDFRLYKNLFDGVPNSDNYNTLLIRDGLDTPFVSQIEYEERIARAKALSGINVIQNQNQEQNQIVKVDLHRYEQVNQFAELFAEAVKQMKQKEVPSEILSEAKEAQDLLDSLTRDSKSSDIAKTLRRINRVMNEVKDLLSNGSLIVSTLATLMKVFNL